MRTCLFDEWEFCMLDEAVQNENTKEIDAKAAAESATEWRSVTLPHDWSTDYPFDPQADTCGSGGYAKAGLGAYRRKFKINANEDQRQLLYFEGVYMKSSVYVDGVYAGGHVYGYTPFAVDITRIIKEDDIQKEHELLVIVDNSKQPGSRWYSGSGITRDVWLESQNSTHFARYGVYTTTKEDVIRAELSIFTENQAEKGLRLTYTVKDPQGKIVASGEKAVTKASKFVEKCDEKEMSIIEGFDTKDFEEAKYEISEEIEIKVEEAKLWTADEPNLYELQLILLQNEEPVDERTQTIGFRKIAFDAERGFLLNGEQLKLNGVCLHHDGGSVGAAVPAKIWERRLKKLKDMGVNSIRFSHNPPDTALLDLCDRMGFLVMDEAFDEWKLMKAKEVGSNTHESHGYSLYFDDCYEWDLKTMVYRDRNHPSIILWSIGNEIPEEVVEGGEALAIEMREFCHKIDPSRKITLANDQIVAEPRAARQEFLEELDVVGYNYAGRWRKRAETFYDEDHAKYPHRCVIGTENPSAGYVRSVYKFEHDRNSFWDKPYYSAAVSAGKLLRYTMTHDFVAGDYMWTGIDYLGEAHWPGRSAGCGCLDTCGFEKDAFYFYKSVWKTEEPFAYLCPHWNLDIEQGTVIPVICYTNCEDAELFVNGKSYGVKTKGFPCYGMTERYGHFDRYRRPANTDDLFLSWDVPYEPGKIEVIGYKDGEKVCEYLVETTQEAAQIELRCDTKSLKRDGRDIAEIEIRILDEKGRLVPDYCKKLNFSLEGEGEIIGIDNGDPNCHEQWKQTENRSVFNGMMYAVVRAKKDAKKLLLKVESAQDKSILPVSIEL